MTTCEGSGNLIHVSDYDVHAKKTVCKYCGQSVRISIPDKKMHGNRAKLAKHKSSIV